jgi:hypothetical protein
MNSYTATLERTTEGGTEWYRISEENGKGETIEFEINKCEDPNEKNSLPKLWYKKGFTKTLLKNFWHIQTYVTAQNGDCYGIYNPTICREKNEIDFSWLLPATTENKGKLIEEIVKQFSRA